jgi:hypothetical protein
VLSAVLCKAFDHLFALHGICLCCLVHHLKCNLRVCDTVFVCVCLFGFFNFFVFASFGFLGGFLREVFSSPQL